MTTDVYKIVLIDDDEDDNYLHRTCIESIENAKVVGEFCRAREALTWFQQGPRNVDIIFLDINMPEMNGFEFLEKYYELDKSLHAKMLVFLLTSSLLDVDRQRAVSLGAKLGAKPLTREKFVQLVEKLE